MTGAELTERQREVMLAIQACIVEHGYPPTLKDLAERLRLGSVAGVREHVRALARKGYIAVTPKVSRGLRVLIPVPSVFEAAP